MADDKGTARVIVPFAFILPNADNPGLKDFTPAVVPASTPDEVTDSAGEAGDGDSPKVSSAVESAPSSRNPSEANDRPDTEVSPANAAKDSQEEAPTSKK